MLSTVFFPVNWFMQVYRAFSLTWPACAQIYCNKRKRLHNKRVHLPLDWIGTPTWPPWRHLKTLYPPLWGCEGDRFEMVVKVYCGTVLRTKLPPCWKCVPQNSPTMHLTSISDPVSRTTSKWRIECFQMTSRRPCWCPNPILWEMNSFLMQTLSFVAINLRTCWPREWKRSINLRKSVDRKEDSG